MSGPESVTVIGLGPMGQAMVRTLIAAGHPVTVWNRTAGRADGVVADGARLAATPTDAVSASELVILSLTDYQAMYDVLGDAADVLKGRTLANLSSDTPDRTREAAAWTAERGATMLTGGVMAPAPMLGSEAAYVYYSGPADLLDRHRAALSRIGSPRYLGGDPGLAQLMYQAHLDVFLSALSSLMHATALMESGGMSATEFLPEVMPTLTGIPAMLSLGPWTRGRRERFSVECLARRRSEGALGLCVERSTTQRGALRGPRSRAWVHGSRLSGGENVGAQIDAGEHPGHLSTAAMMGATADHIVATSEAVGIDLDLPRAVQAHYRRAIDAGHGGDNWTRIIDGIRSPS